MCEPSQVASTMEIPTLSFCCGQYAYGFIGWPFGMVATTTSSNSPASNGRSDGDDDNYADASGTTTTTTTVTMASRRRTTTVTAGDFACPQQQQRRRCYCGNHNHAAAFPREESKVVAGETSSTSSQFRKPVHPMTPKALLHRQRVYRQQQQQYPRSATYTEGSSCCEACSTATVPKNGASGSGWDAVGARGTSAARFLRSCSPSLLGGPSLAGASVARSSLRTSSPVTGELLPSLSHAAMTPSSLTSSHSVVPSTLQQQPLSEAAQEQGVTWRSRRRAHDDMMGTLSFSRDRSCDSAYTAEEMAASGGRDETSAEGDLSSEAEFARLTFLPTITLRFRSDGTSETEGSGAI